jgi:hypothetical protein
MRQRLSVLAILLAATLLSGHAFAQNRDESWEMGPFITFNDFDADTEIDDDSGFGFRFGYNFTAMHELEFSFDGVDTEDDVFGVVDVEVDKFMTSYLLNFVFSRRQQVIPFFTAGVGWIRIESSSFGFGSDSEVDQLFTLGGGVRFFTGRIFHIRLDARRIFFEGDNDVLAGDDFTNTQLTAGVGWVFGGR